MKAWQLAHLIGQDVDVTDLDGEGGRGIVIGVSDRSDGVPLIHWDWGMSWPLRDDARLSIYMPGERDK